MIFPVILIFVALSAAAAVAFGTHASIAQMDQGLSIILCCRRLQWLLVGVSVAASLGLVALSMSNRKRAWWLLGLAPVLALFAQRFATDRAEDFAVVEDPAFVEIEKADFIKDGDWVVCLKLNDKAFAYPYAALYVEPTIVQTEHDKRIALFWNASANRVTAFTATTDFRGRDLDVVSTPNDSLLVYNARFGQFICGVTGLTPQRQKPTGLGSAVATGKCTFAQWKAANPTGRVMQPSQRAARQDDLAPTQPIPSHFAVQLAATTLPTALSAESVAARRKVTLVGSSKLLAVDVSSLSQKPNPVSVDDQPAVLLKTTGGPTGVRGFLRKLDDLSLRFEAKKDAKLADVRMTDRETGSLWSAAGVAVGGTPQFRGRRLAVLPVDEDVDLEVMKKWMPELEVYAEPAPPPVALKKPTVAGAAPATRPTRKFTRKASPAAVPQGAVTTRRRPAAATKTSGSL